MTEHILVITRDEKTLELLARYRAIDEQDRRDHYDMTIECPTPEKCSGWQECLEEHEPGNDFGPYDAEEGAPWEGQDEFEFHGCIHTWRYDGGWTVPYEGCIVSSVPWGFNIPDEIDTSKDGRYIVEDEWYDNMCYINYVNEIINEEK